MKPFFLLGSALSASLVMWACGETLPVASDAGVDSADAGADVINLYQHCANNCEMHIRARLYIGLYPDDERTKDASLTVTQADGTVLTLEHLAGAPCGNELGGGTCAFGYFTIPDEPIPHLTLHNPGEPDFSFDVTLRAFNYCSRDLAVVPLYRTDAGAGWRVGDTQFYSPCEGMP